jgi:hypothetical protein
MKARSIITLALLAGCNYDYSVLSQVEDAPAQQPLDEDPGTYAVGEAVPGPWGLIQVQPSQPLDEETQEAPPSQDTGEYTDPIEETEPESPPAEEPPPEPPAEDTDEEIVEEEPPPPEEPPVEEPPPDEPPPPPPVEPPPEEPPPPVEPPIEWVVALDEDYEDGVSTWTKFNGGCGGQPISANGDTKMWSMRSDWNGTRTTIPEPDARGHRLTTLVQLGPVANSAVVRWRSKEIAWNTNDDGGWSVYLVGGGYGAGAYVGGTFVEAIPFERGLWYEVSIEELDGAYSVFIDGFPLFDGLVSEAPGAGWSLEFHGNGACNSPNFQVEDVLIEVAR